MIIGMHIDLKMSDLSVGNFVYYH